MHKAGLWNYQILLFVHGQVNGQNPLVQTRFIRPKFYIFLISRRKHILWVRIRSASPWVPIRSALDKGLTLQTQSHSFLNVFRQYFSLRYFHSLHWCVRRTCCLPSSTQPPLAHKERCSLLFRRVFIMCRRFLFFRYTYSIWT